MTRLQVSLLGALEVVVDGRPVTGFESSKVRALLAYLAAQPERPHNRDLLTGLLWPHQPEEVARANLRQALSNLRRTIHDASAEPPFLLVTRESVRFNPAGDSLVDLATFTALFEACNRHTHRRLEVCIPCSQRLRQAVELYRGPFLDGLFVQESVAFEEWMLLQRDELQRQVLQALYQLAAYYERRGAYDEAHSYAWRQLEIDPWREEAHRQVMRLLVLRGERSAALAQYETCRRLLREGLGVEPTEETTELYERIRASERSDMEGSGSGYGYVGSSGSSLEGRLVLPSLHPHNLPLQPTPFVGREHELVELAQLIERPECRLISLTGQGGSGKTRLALQAATEQIGAFADGVYFVSLAPVRSGEFLASTIGSAIGLSFSSHKDEQSQLLDELSDKEVLLVLDNLEHLSDATGLLAAILNRAPGVKIIATTRERMNLQGEWVLAVSGLPYPEEAMFGDLGSYAAVQLFTQSARRLDSSFVLDEEDKRAVVRICRLLGGLPLAVELAAAWTPTLSCDEIAQEITRNLDFLTTHLRDVPERHRSMRAVFDYSWNLLSEEERLICAGLSIFQGGFRREAAEQAMGATLPVLSSLIAKSWLHRGPPGRYQMHELLRQYAYTGLGEVPGAAALAQDRHADYYADFVQRREERLRGKEQLSAIEEITADIDNVRQAWRWSIEQKKIETIDRLIDGLWIYYESRGLLHEADESFGRAVSVLSFGTETGTEEIEDKEQVLVLGKVLARHGAISGSRLGRTIKGRHLLERSITLLSRIGAHREIAFSLNLLGTVARLQSEYEQARGFLERSLALFREAGDRWGTAYSLSDLGNVAYLLGEYKGAKQLHEESLHISREAGDRRAMIFCLNDMASVAIALGEYADAGRYCEEVLAISREIGHRWGRANALHQMGTIALYSGHYPQAQSLLEESLDAFKEIGDRQHMALPLQQLGYLAFSRGNYSLAQRLLREVLVLCEETSYRRGMAAALNTLGRVAQALGEGQAALSHLHRALGIAMGIEAWPVALDILASTAETQVGEGQPEQGREILSLVAEHPAANKQTRDRVREIEEMMTADPSRQPIAASSKRQTRTLEQIVEEVLSAGVQEA